MFWFPLQTLCLCLHRGTPLLCVCLCIVLWVCSCAWYCYGKKVYGIKIILSFFSMPGLLFIVAISNYALFLLPFSVFSLLGLSTHFSTFEKRPTSILHIALISYLYVSVEKCACLYVCVCPTCKSCPLPKQTVQWIISHVRRRVRHVIRLKWISFLCVSVSGCVSMYVYDT